MKKRMCLIKKTIALALACTVTVSLLPMSTLAAKSKKSKKAAKNTSWVATPYTKEDGTVAEGLEEAVSGKRHWLETSEQLPAKASVKDGVLTVGNGIITREFKIPKAGETGFYTQRYYNEYLEKELLEDKAVPDTYLGLYDETYDEIYDDSGVKVTQDPIASMDNKLEIPDGAIKIDPDYFYVGGEGTKENTFVFDGYEIKEKCEVPFEWKPNEKYGDPAAADWPPKGVHIEFNFSASKEFPAVYQGIKVKVIYEMFDNMPAMKKKIEITNTGEKEIVIGRMAPQVMNGNKDMDELLLLEHSYLSGDQSALPVGRKLPCRCDSEKKNSPFKALEGMNHTCYEVGPAYDLAKDQTFVSYDTYELNFSTYWFELQMRERMGMYRNLFPWITDNPLTFHNTEALTKEKIDHAAEAGFNMIIQSYSAPDESGQMLSRDQATLDKYKGLVDYAHSKGIDIGIYQAQYTLGQYKGGYEYGGNDVGQWGTWCVASAAFDDYWDNFKYFVKYTGLDCVEIDGTYPGTYCNRGHDHVNADKETDPDPQGTDKAAGDASKYAVHRGFFDSNVKQWENAVRMLCGEFRDMGVYIKVPAWYYLNGANKCGIGYEEAAWSQPRHEQLIYGRQIIHNASYARSMSMSWSHVPFAQYHGGGESAAFQPFKDHMEDYNWVMAQNLGNGIASDFRGTALFDEETQNICNKWVDFYNRYRTIVNSDLVHISQAGYEDDRTRNTKMDTLYHVNAKNDGEKGLLWVYNQTDEERTETITVPMYYTGLTNMNYPPVPLKGSLGKDVHSYGTYPPNYKWLPSEEGNYRMPDVTDQTTGNASFVREGIEVKDVTIDSNGNAQIKVTLPPMSFTYYAIYEPGEEPNVELNVGKVENVAAAEVTENSAELTWNKDVAISIIEDGVVNDNPAVTVDYYNVYRDGEFLAKSMTNSYKDTNLKENTTYKYTVEAVVSEVKGVMSDGLAVSTNVDDVKPVVQRVSADKANEILVKFSEPIDKATAETTANYKLSGDKNVIYAVVEDEKNVRLTVDELNALESYDLEITNIKDASAAGNVLDPVTNKVVYGYIAKYTLDSLEKGEIADLFGNYNGKIYNAEENELTYGKAASFQAKDAAYADLGIGLLNGLDQYSISMWINPEVSGKQVLLSQGQDKVPENDFTLYLEDGILKFHISNADGKELTLAAENQVKAGEWTFVTLVRDGDKFSLGMNDKVTAEKAVAGLGTCDTTNAFRLAAITNHAGGDRTLFYSGLVDEVALYKVPLSAQQMNDLYGSYAEKFASILAKARAIDGTYYTEAPYAELQTAITALEDSILNNAAASDILKAAKTLEDALAGLVKKDVYKDLAASYKMNEANGSVIGDGIAGENAVLENGDYLRYGTPFGKGVYMTKIKNNVITISELPLKSQDAYSISGWFKSQVREVELEDAGKQTLFSDEGGHVVLSLENNKLVLELNNGKDTETKTAEKAIATDTVTGGEVRTAWNHFALTKDGNIFTVYQNGEEVVKAELTDVKMDARAYIGSKAKADIFNGLVDEFAVYAKALTADEAVDMAKALPFDKGEEENVALNKTLMSDGMDDAFRLNDGKVLDFLDQGTPWTARTSGSGVKYGFDLGAEHEITALSLTQFFRPLGDEGLRRYRDVIIQVSTTEDFSEDVTTVFNTDTDNSLGYGARTDDTYYSFELGYDIMLDEPVTGRYVRLINSGFINSTGNYESWVNISELEVYAESSVAVDGELAVSREAIDLKVNGDREFVKVTTDAVAPAANVTAVSADETVATVTNKDGILQINAVGKGNTVITVKHPTDETVTKEIQVEVKGLEPKVIIDDTDEAIKYTGDIAGYTDRGDFEGVTEYNRSIHYSSSVGDTVEYTFSGTGIDVITTVNVDGGESEISIDGEVIETVDTMLTNVKYPKRANQMCVFSKTDLEDGEHTIKIVNKSGNMTTDAFRIYKAEVDKSELETLYEQYKDANETDYTADSWGRFKEALDNAKAVLDNPDAASDDVNAAYDALSAAYDELTTNVDKSELEALYNAHKDKINENYTDESWAAFRNALTTAKAALDNRKATSEQVKEAFDALTAAVSGLTKKVDKSALETLYIANKEKTNDNYTEESWTAFQNALAATKEVLDNAEAAQTDVDTAFDALTAAITGLTKKVDKAKLRALFNANKDTVNDNYTEESWTAFQNALAAAKAVIDNTEATQADVDVAFDALAAAITGLTREEQPSEPGNGGNNNGGNNNNGNNNGGGNNTDTGKKTTSPKKASTGDAASVSMILMMAMASAGAAGVAIKRKKKED